MKMIFKRAWTAWLFMPVFFSCATYNQSMTGYYENIRLHKYDKALTELQHNKLIRKNRNQLLYYLESGKIYRLKNDLQKSNQYFNLADKFIENTNRSATDIAVGNLMNPMQQTYRGEDFEQFMIHYYKALNYTSLGQTDEAVVEARRITLSANSQADKFGNKQNRYSKDAFALNLQGMIYEMAGDINNAFIAYRNAADIYLNAKNDYYGVPIPPQLQQDLLRSATAMGFDDQRSRYEKIFQAPLKNVKAEGGELILFLEEGRAPVKEEKDFTLTSAGSIGNFNYIDAEGRNSGISFNYNSYGISETKLTDLRILRVALPVYRVVSAMPLNLNVSVNGNNYKPQAAQNINNIAVSVLKERFLSELGKALARQITKQLLEKGTAAATTAAAKKKEKKLEKDNRTEAEKESDRKKNEEKAKAAGEAAGFIMNIVNSATEKADTRNWQSLPAFISYLRVPLAAGENIINVTANGKIKTLKVNGGNGLQMMSEVFD